MAYCRPTGGDTAEGFFTPFRTRSPGDHSCGTAARLLVLEHVLAVHTALPT